MYKINLEKKINYNIVSFLLVRIKRQNKQGLIWHQVVTVADCLVIHKCCSLLQSFGCYHHCNCKGENLASEPPKPNSWGYSKEFGFFRIFFSMKKIPFPGKFF